MRWNDRFNAPWVRLGGARLCLDCDVIYNADSCPICDSRQSYWITEAIPALRPYYDKERKDGAWEMQVISGGKSGSNGRRIGRGPGFGVLAATFSTLRGRLRHSCQCLSAETAATTKIGG